MKTAMNWMGTVALLLTGVFPLCAQDGIRGHWSGAVEVPGQTLAMDADLDKAAAGWIGSVSIPAQNATGIPLDAITFADGKFSFHVKGAPGDPTFTGTLSADGKTMTGNFAQGPGSFPFKFTRSGDPKVEMPKNSPAVAKEFLGTWEGTLEAGQPLRLVLKISNDDTGAKAVMTSVDQGGAQIPVSAIEQKGSKINLEVKMVGGGFQGQLNSEGTVLSGTWTQGGNDLPLALKKAGAEAKKP